MHDDAARPAPALNGSSHILIVEDDEAIACLLEAFLEAEGLYASHVGDGRAAVAQVEEMLPDLILMDLMLPGMSGLAAIAAIRASLRPEIARTPIIAMSAGVNLKHVTDDQLADDVLAKPFDLDAVLSLVARHLAPARSRYGQVA